MSVDKITLEIVNELYNKSTPLQLHKASLYAINKLLSIRENKNTPIDIDIGSVFIRIGTDRYDGRVSVEDISCATPDELAIKIASKFLGNTVETYTMSVGIQNLIIASLTNGGVLEYYDIGTGDRINYEYVEFVISRK